MWGLWKKNYGEYGDYGNYRNYGESNYGNYKFLFRFVAQKHFSKKEKLQKIEKNKVENYLLSLYLSF